MVTRKQWHRMRAKISLYLLFVLVSIVFKFLIENKDDVIRIAKHYTIGG